MGSTDFTAHSDVQLAQMLAAGDPAAISAAGDAWADAARSLYARAGDMEQQLRAFEPYWTGGAATRYGVMIRGLIAGLQRVGDTARMVAEYTYTAGEALQSARSRMPAPVAIAAPAGPPAAQLLTELAARYDNIQASMPAMPDTAAPPTTAEVLSGDYFRTQPANAATPPLFGDMYRNGLASAASALGGGFSSALPSLVGPPPPPVASSDPSPALAGTKPLDLAAAHHSGHGGSSVIGSASVGAHAIASPSLAAGGESGSAVLGVAGAAAGSAVAGARAGGMGGFMPPMIPPYGGGSGMGGDGQGRHVPHWLTEPEPEVVFGVPLSAVISVIGETDAPAGW